MSANPSNYLNKPGSQEFESRLAVTGLHHRRAESAIHVWPNSSHSPNLKVKIIRSKQIESPIKPFKSSPNKKLEGDGFIHSKSILFNGSSQGYENNFGEFPNINNGNLPINRLIATANPDPNILKYFTPEREKYIVETKESRKKNRNFDIINKYKSSNIDENPIENFLKIPKHIKAISENNLIFQELKPNAFQNNTPIFVSPPKHQHRTYKQSSNDGIFIKTRDIIKTHQIQSDLHDAKFNNEDADEIGKQTEEDQNFDNYILHPVSSLRENPGAGGIANDDVIQLEEEIKENIKLDFHENRSNFQTPRNINFSDATSLFHVKQIKVSENFRINRGKSASPASSSHFKNHIRASPQKGGKNVNLFHESSKIAEIKKQLFRPSDKLATMARTKSNGLIEDSYNLKDIENSVSDRQLNQSDEYFEEEDADELNTTPRAGLKILLLESVYEGRASTIFFQYPTCCEKIRNSSHTVALAPEEEKNYDLKYKSPHIMCIIKSLESGGFKPATGTSWNVFWGKPKNDRVKEMSKFQKTNHFPGCWQLGRKDNLWKNVSRLKRQHPSDYDFIPNTYLLGSDYERFSHARENSEGKGLWIMKPCASACGRGIKLINRKTKIKKKVNYLVSEYISNPHLINGLKYDLRIYVVVSCYDPLRIYLYNEGLVRFATEKYSCNSKHLKERFIHLTNWSVNKYSEKFVKNESLDNMNASKWSLSNLMKYFEEKKINHQAIMSKIKDIIIKTLISAEPSMLNSTSRTPEHRNNCFELYGFDILLDSHLKPWLMEVNVCPSLNSSSPLDRKVKTSLISDIMNMVGIQPYDKKKLDEEQKKKIPATEGRKYPTKNINDIQELTEDNCLEKLSIEDWNILFETDEEWYRKGDFERIFPTRDTIDVYSKFFEFQRYNNVLVWRWMKSKSNFLEKISKKKTFVSV